MTQSLINYPSDTNQLVKQAAPSNQLNLSAQALNASFQSLANLITALQADLGNYLLLSGGTMSGNIDMEGYDIVNSGTIFGSNGDYSYDFGDNSNNWAGYFSDSNNNIYVANNEQGINVIGSGYTANLADSMAGAAGYFLDPNDNTVYLANYANAITTNGTIYNGHSYIFDNVQIFGSAFGVLNVFADTYSQAINTTGYGFTANLADSVNGAAGYFQDSYDYTVYLSNNSQAVSTSGNGYTANLSDGNIGVAAGYFLDSSENTAYLANGTNAIQAIAGSGNWAGNFLDNTTAYGASIATTGYAGQFVAPGYLVNLGDTIDGAAVYAYDGSNTVYLANGGYALTTVGDINATNLPSSPGSPGDLFIAPASTAVASNYNVICIT